MLKVSSYLPVLLASVLASGCANLDAVSKFAGGTHALAEASGQFYDMTLETDRQLAAMTVDLGSAENSPDCAGKNGSQLTPWDCATRVESLMSETRRNRAAVQALDYYAQGLDQIARLDEDKQVEKAAKELSGNLDRLLNTLEVDGPKDESALAKAISSVANIYIDLKASKLVHKKAEQAQEGVSIIVQTLLNDIQRQHKRIKANRENAKATRELWFNSFRDDYKAPSTSGANKVALSIAAGHLVEDELVEKLAEQPNKQFLDNLERTAKSCLDAHLAIQDPDLKDRAENVGSFFKDAKNLLSSVKHIDQ
jgi:hypothetical protein